MGMLNLEPYDQKTIYSFLSIVSQCKKNDINISELEEYLLDKKIEIDHLKAGEKTIENNRYKACPACKRMSYKKSTQKIDGYSFMWCLACSHSEII